MAKIKTTCGTCKVNCQQGITLFSRDDEVEKLIKQFPFFKLIRSSVAVVGKKKKQYMVLKCERLKENGLCENPPENSPAWCRVES